ncbi:hypothetical protein BC940DRAFT_356809 [Gongronella butleri]|nr:hypothetical protein BC940DRAFT_356809 [Gongronella butleri]
MEFKRLFSRVHDKMASPEHPPQEQGDKERRFARWRKWDAVHLFHAPNKAGAALPQSPPPSPTPHDLSPLSHPTSCMPYTATRSRHRQVASLRPRLQSAAPPPPPLPLHRVQPRRPASCTPCVPSSPLPAFAHHRLSVPHVVDHLRSIPDSPSSTVSSFENDHDDYPPLDELRPINWHQLPHSSLTSVSQDTTRASSSPPPRSSMTKFTPSPPSYPLSPSSSTSARFRSAPPMHAQLVMLHVENTMQRMHEQHLTRQLDRAQQDTRQLRQRIDELTRTASLHLVEENRQLHRQVLQLQQHLPTTQPSSSSPSLHQDQQVLRHTRAQLGLIEFLEGEPDIRAALERFKQLLMASC